MTNNYDKIHEFPMLYAKNKNNVWKQWSVRVVSNERDENPIIETQHGQYGGKFILDQTYVSTLKRGSLTLWDQAVKMAQSKWNHKHNRENYIENMTDDTMTTKQRVSPMLAKTFDKGKHLTYPLYIQPKIDGLRCLAEYDGVSKSVILYSRTGCVFQSTALDGIREHLKSYFQKNNGSVIDGELYSHDISFEELNGYCRKQNAECPVSIIYNVFDVVIPDLVFHERLDYFPLKNKFIHIVPTLQIDNEDQIQNHLQDFIQNGYEGIILRNKDGKYNVGHRSWDLQKYKLFKEEEFVIVGYAEGVGREKGLVIWECETHDGKVFKARPKGDHENRKKVFQEADQYIGKKMTVIFQEYTKDGIPRFPVAKAIREGY